MQGVKVGELDVVAQDQPTSAPSTTSEISSPSVVGLVRIWL